jgi:ATP-dependent RNA helicase DDX27
VLGLQVVVNFDAARTLETHLHRIGRTARAGASGLAVTFVEDGDRALLKEVGLHIEGLFVVWNAIF